MPRDTIVDRFFHQVTARASLPAYYERVDNNWHSTNWATYGEQVRLFAAALIAHGCQPGDTLNICGYNCPQWVIADLGAMACGVVPSGIYHTDSPAQVAFILNHSEAKILVLEDLHQWEKFNQITGELPSLERLIMIRDAHLVDDEKILSFDDFLKSGAKALHLIDQRLAEIKEDDLATLIYTSGTTGPPKAVMLSHHNLATTANMAFEVVRDVLVTEDDCLVSYLPLSHIAEQMFTIHLAATLGYPIYFAPSIDQVRETLIQARPALLFAVPRVWEKVHASLKERLDQATGIQKLVINLSRKIGTKTGPEIIEFGKPQSKLLSLSYTVADKVFFQKVTRQVGLDRLRIAISAAAPIGQGIIEYFLSCGIIIHEIYGQSEGSGPSTMNYPQPGRRKLGTVGIPMPGVEIKLADHGEVLVRGPNIFMGYYKDKKATKETLVDGWLHSGDIGEIDDDGFLTITDRKKNIIITSGGKNIAPTPIEEKIKAFHAISDCLIIGDQRKFLSALITLDAETAPAMARRHNWPPDPEELAHFPPFLDALQTHIDQVNADVARVESIRRFHIIPHEFSEERGELTPTKKVKRNAVEKLYATEIDALYS